MNFKYALIFCLLLLPFRSFAGACFDPTLDPSIRSALAPERRFNETPATIDQIHNLIWEHRRVLDPRLVYFRMIGESGADPFVRNSHSGAYGMFQFLGRPFRSSRTHRQILEAAYRKAPRTSPRLIQVKYYLEQYVQKAKEAADAGYGCLRGKQFAQYSNLQKSAFLGWGSCTANRIREELSLCRKNENYRSSGACGFGLPVLQGRKLPLCT